MHHRRIDIQHHYLPPAYLRAVGTGPIGETLVSGQSPDWTPEISLEAMDRNGIDHAVMSLSAPGFHFFNPRAAAALCADSNRYGSDLHLAHPERFTFFASLPLPHVEAALAELDTALALPGSVGVTLLTNHGGRYLGDPAFRPLMAELDRRAATVFVHPADVSGQRPLPHLPAATLEFPFDTTRAITDLLFSSTLNDFHNIKFIFSHAGGTLPFLADRISRLERRPDLAAKVPGGALAALKKLNFDVALSAGPSTLKSLLNFVPPSQVVFGSDFPFAGEDTMSATVRLLSGAGLGDEALAAINSGTALALLPRLSALLSEGMHA